MTDMMTTTVGLEDVSEDILDMLRPFARRCGFETSPSGIIHFCIALTERLHKRKNSKGQIPFVPPDSRWSINLDSGRYDDFNIDVTVPDVPVDTLERLRPDAQEHLYGAALEEVIRFAMQVTVELTTYASMDYTIPDWRTAFPRPDDPEEDERLSNKMLALVIEASEREDRERERHAAGDASA